MLNINDLKSGLTVKLEGAVYLIVSAEQVKPGKGSAFVRLRLKNMQTGTLIDRTFRSGEKMEEAFVSERKVQYLYRSGDAFHFMDTQTYEQLEVNRSHLRDSERFLKENTVVSLIEYESQVLDVKLPLFVELKVVQAEPGLRGDTAKGGNKLATIETGAAIQVPLFVQEGDIVKIDTRTGSYAGRV